MKIEIENKVIELSRPCRIIELFNNKGYNYYAASVNNRLRELDYIVSKDSKIELLDIKNQSVTRMYQATLRYIIVMALRNIRPKARINFRYSVSRHIFASVSHLGHPFLQQDLNDLKNEVTRIINEDIPITRFSLTKAEAQKYYRSVGWYDKIDVLKYRKNPTVHVYKCLDFYDYMYGYMLPSTGYIKSFDLKLYAPGFLISYPRNDLNGEEPELADEKVFREVLKEANYWANITGASSIAQINKKLDEKAVMEFINICEAKHNNQLSLLGEKIFKNINKIRLICVAGPSSSGKTTFTNRLKIELKVRGIQPLMISMDDFYRVDQENYPKLPDGKPDLEHIEALDLELFDSTIFNLISGEEVALPVYDFHTGTRSFGEPIKINPNQPILIEGIHGLDDAICPSIPDEAKFKIYIAPLIQYTIDDHNPISLSDLRLVRRMVRDFKFRGTGCEKTLSTWQSVRDGEFKWIYPYQNNADYVFNSELGYELLVMSKHAIPLLEEVKNESPNYIAANRLLKFLRLFEHISDKWVPCNSILREFIGDSIFYTTDTK